MKFLAIIRKWSVNEMRKIFKSFGHAFRGISLLVRTQRNAQIHLLATVIVIIGAIAFQLASGEWALILLAIALVWSAEGLNTAIEFLADKVEPAHDSQIKKVKDLAAGAVLIAAILAFAIACFIFIPKFIA